MRVLETRNVHEALPIGIEFLKENGIRRDSRNGPVLVAPWPVTTIYQKPLERVIFWPQRDANPFFHLYESLWMLAGRNDVAPLERYVKNSINYSDDGVVLWGAYGHRWRKHFSLYNSDEFTTGTLRPDIPILPHDQLAIIAQRLKKDSTDRRCVLQMWDAEADLGKDGKDFPCNTIATFQRGIDGELNITVFCRSNDIVWGAYGANAVQFSILLEYIAFWIGCPVGTYAQVSVNWHAYDNEVWRQVENIPTFYRQHAPYEGINGKAHHVPMTGDIQSIDRNIHHLLADADSGIFNIGYSDSWSHMVYLVLAAHHTYKSVKDETRFGKALDILNHGDREADWIVAAREWILRREKTYKQKQDLLGGKLSHP